MLTDKKSNNDEIDKKMLHILFYLYNAILIKFHFYFCIL